MSLVFDNVSFTVRGQQWIAPTSLSLAHASLNVLLGPTLSGKTTLMRLMAGLDVPTSGRILFDGKDVTGIPVRRRNVAMVYQQFINYTSLSVYENIASPLRVKGLPKAEIEARVSKAAKLLKLEPYLTRLPLELPGGQQQRTAIARALVKEAGLVLLDEPLANLDYKLREELREELPRIFAESGAIFVYATTEPSEALLLGGKTATLHQGHVTQFGPTIDVYRHPADSNTAQVFSDPPMNFASATLSGKSLTLQDGTKLATDGLPALKPGDYQIGFRPNHTTIHASKKLQSIKARVGVSEITGSESFIHVEACGARWIALEPGVHELKPGSAINIYLDPSRFFVFSSDGRLVAAPKES